MKRIIFLFGLLILTSCTYNEITPVCKPDEQMFSDLVQPIIESNCISCHDEASDRPAILGTYDGVIHALNNHSLKELVVSFQMPKNSTMSESDINIIKNWADCE